LHGRCAGTGFEKKEGAPAVAVKRRWYGRGGEETPARPRPSKEHCLSAQRENHAWTGGVGGQGFASERQSIYQKGQKGRGSFYGSSITQFPRVASEPLTPPLSRWYYLGHAANN
jgi:hypothetical protein